MASDLPATLTVSGADEWQLPQRILDQGPRAVQAFLLYLHHPKMLKKDIAAEIGVAQGTFTRWLKEGDWDGAVTEHVNFQISLKTRREAALQAEAQRSRHAHIRVNPSTQQLLELQLREMAEIDEEGNVLGLKDVVIGHTKDGEAIYGKPQMKDVQALINSLAKHWEHSSKVTGLDFSEKLALQAAKDNAAKPAQVVVNVGRLGPGQAAHGFTPVVEAEVVEDEP